MGIVVPIVGDTLDELNETFLVNLSNATGASIAISQATGKINDNDAPPKLVISDVTVTETNGGTFAVFMVKLSAASGLLVTANFATVDGTAKAGSDYTGSSLGSSVTFNPGDTTPQFVSVAVGRDDLIHGPTKTFSVKLSAALNAVFADSLGIGTILDDD